MGAKVLVTLKDGNGHEAICFWMLVKKQRKVKPMKCKSYGAVFNLINAPIVKSR